MLALASLLDPTALAWPVFLLLLRWLAPGTGPSGRALGWALGGAFVGALLGIGPAALADERPKVGLALSGGGAKGGRKKASKQG